MINFLKISSIFIGAISILIGVCLVDSSIKLFGSFIFYGSSLIYFSLKLSISRKYLAIYFLFNLPWLALFYFQGYRRFTALYNGQVEGPNGEGSPLAFLMGLVMETPFYILSLLIPILTIVVLFKFNKSLYSATPTHAV